MKEGELGSTGKKVTPLCLGTAALGNMPEAFGYSVSEEQASKTLRTALKGPINFIDTSSNYGLGEERIGKLLREIGGLPENIVLQTKVDWDLTRGDFSADQVKRSLEQSMKLLGVDMFPIVYLHDVEFAKFDKVMKDQGPYGVLRNYQDQGIIDHIGVSGGPISLLKKYVETGAFEAVITACRYTLLYRTAEDLIEMAHARKMAILNAAPFGSGILADPTKERYAYAPADSDLIRRVAEMNAICKSYKVPLKAAALQFSVKDPRISSTIIGPTTPEQLEENIALLEIPLPDQLWEDLKTFVIQNSGPQTALYKKLDLPYRD